MVFIKVFLKSIILSLFEMAMNCEGQIQYGEALQESSSSDIAICSNSLFIKLTEWSTSSYTAITW